MRAQLKGGRIVSGKLAEIFVRKRLATIVSDEETIDQIEVDDDLGNLDNTNLTEDSETQYFLNDNNPEAEVLEVNSEQEKDQEIIESEQDTVVDPEKPKRGRKPKTE